MNYSVLGDDIGKLVLRLTLGVLIALHGVSKLMNFQAASAGLAKQVVALGLPEFVAYGVYVGEVVAPVLLILGVLSRVGGVLVVINMLFAVVMVH